MNMLQRRSSLRLWLAAIIAFVVTAGCARGVTAFEVVAAGHPYAVREQPGHPLEEEGTVIDGSTPRYHIRGLSEVAGSAQFDLIYGGDGAGLELRIYDDEGVLVAARRLPAASALGPLLTDRATTELGVALPPGARLAEFDVVSVSQDHQPAGSQPTFRIEGVRIGDAASGLRLDDRVHLGPGVAVQAREITDAETITRSWQVRLSEPPDAGTPLVISYTREAYQPADPPFEPDTAVVSVAAGRTLDVRLRAGRNELYVYPELAGAVPQEITLQTTSESVTLRSVRWAEQPVRAAGGRDPLPIDLGSLLVFPRESWRSEEFELFAWAKYPNVLVMDTRDYAVQAQFFKRLAFFVEKSGFRGRLLSDEELAGRHGYNAHNYNGDGLAGFYNAALESGFPLNEYEMRLQEMVLAAGIIVRDAGRYVPGEGGVLSISRESGHTPGLRELLLTHEAMHGIFYAEPGFVDDVVALWDRLDPDVRRLFDLYFSAMYYDVSDEYLRVNEFQAYVLQQPHDSVVWYYRTRVASRLAQWLPHEQSWLDAFYPAHPTVFVDLSVNLNQSLFVRTGFSGGDVFSVSPRDGL